jgi:hypothetical protein
MVYIVNRIEYHKMVDEYEMAINCVLFTLLIVIYVLCNTITDVYNVISAEWGPLVGVKSDVTAAFVANFNSTSGQFVGKMTDVLGDPAPGYAKTLIVAYTKNGVHSTFTHVESVDIRDNTQTLQL